MGRRRNCRRYRSQNIQHDYRRLQYFANRKNAYGGKSIEPFGTQRNGRRRNAPSLTLAGMVAVTSVTSSLGAIGISIADKEMAVKDFFTTPVSRGKITFSYILASAIVGLIMTLAALALCVVYIAVNGGMLPNFAGFAHLLLTSVLSVLCGNAIVFFISAYAKDQSAFVTLSSVVGTLIGFLMGVYIPIGTMPNSVQWLIKYFPMTHAASMFKQILADEELSELFANAPPEALGGFRESFGMTFTYGDFTGGFWFSAAVLVVTTVMFYILSLAVISVRRV